MLLYYLLRLDGFDPIGDPDDPHQMLFYGYQEALELWRINFTLGIGGIVLGVLSVVTGQLLAGTDGRHIGIDLTVGFALFGFWGQVLDIARVFAIMGYSRLHGSGWTPGPLSSAPGRIMRTVMFASDLDLVIQLPAAILSAATYALANPV